MMIFAGCQKDGLSTDQYDKDTVALSAYGPQPVVRGGQLRFLGSNLDRIAEVVIPGVSPITEIEVVQAGVPSEIRITVPKDGPEPGHVVLRTGDGIELTTKTELTYSEPIVLEAFSPASVRPGDVLTITGDYLNLIHEVIFAEEVLVSEKDFDSHSRYEIKVKVPAAAQTGVIGIGDIDMTQPENEGLFPNVINSEEELTVALPTVTAVSPSGVRPGDEVTITGTLMDCISSVVFSGATPVTEFDSQSATEIVVTVPSDVHDGPVTCVAASGIEIRSEQSVTVDLPVVTDVEAESVFKAGLKVTISGTDLDMVTGVTFSGDAVAEFSYSDNAITATIPETAVDGVIILATAAEKSVETEAVTLVKPVITGFGSDEILAGDDFTIIGTDLDLVKGVTLNGVECTFTPDDSGQLTVNTVATSTSGKVSVTAANGYRGDSPSELTVTPKTITVVSEITASVTAGENVTMKGSNFNMIEAIYLGESKVTSFVSRSDTEIVFTVPAAVVPGTYYPEFVLTTGERENSPRAVEVQGAVVIKTIWTGSWSAGSWSGNQDLAWGGYDWSSVDLSAGKVTLVAEVEQDASAQWWQFMLKTGTSWADLAGMSQIDMVQGQTIVEVPLTQTMLDDLIANNGLIITGCNYTLKTLSLRIE